MRTLLASAVTAAVLLAGSPAFADGDPEEGKKIFRRCQACHTVQEGQHRLGPSLHGVVGREAGTAEGFAMYSPAMKQSGITWTEDNVEEYLANPREFIAGNRMAFPGLPNEEDRENVVAYLKQVSEGN